MLFLEGARSLLRSLPPRGFYIRAPFVPEAVNPSSFSIPILLAEHFLITLSSSSQFPNQIWIHMCF